MITSCRYYKGARPGSIHLFHSTCFLLSLDLPLGLSGFIDTLRKARQGRAPDTSQIIALRNRKCSIAEAFDRAGDDALWVTHENKTRAALNEADLRRCDQTGSHIAQSGRNTRARRRPTGSPSADGPRR